MRPSSALAVALFGALFLCALGACRSTEQLASSLPSPAGLSEEAREQEQEPEPEGGCAAGAPLGFASLEDQVLYLVMVDRFYDADQRPFRGRDPSDPLSFSGGDLAGVLEKLPYLADLGVTAVWLTPLHLQVEDPVGPPEQRHWPLHGYWPEDHVSLDARFGTEEELRHVIERAHALGMRVVLDVVTNHYGYGAKAARDATRVRSQELGTCPEEGTLRTQCLFGLPDLKTEEDDVREMIADATTSWVCRFPLDGLRLDAAKHVDPELLWEVHDRAERLSRGRGAPDFLALAEHWGATPGDDAVRAYTESGAADTLFDFSFAGLVEGFLSGRMRAEALAHHLERWHEASGPPLVFFLDTHDTTPMLTSLGDAAAARYPLAAFLQMTTYGIPLLTWGDELGRGGGPWPDNRAAMPWERLAEPAGRALHDVWRRLVQLRRALPSLRSRAYRTVLAKTDGETSTATLAYLRGEDALVVVHRGQAAFRVLEGLPPGATFAACASKGTLKERRFTVDERGRLSLALPADAAALLSLSPGPCDT